MVVHLQIECSLRAGKVIAASEDEKYNFLRIAKKMKEVFNFQQVNFPNF